MRNWFRFIIIIIISSSSSSRSSSISSSSITAIELSLCGSSPYTSTEKPNKNKYT